MRGWGYTTKQAKVIYKAWKQGKVEIDKQVMDKIFELADGKNWGCSEGFSMGQAINEAVDDIFRNNYYRAGEKLDYFTRMIGSYDRVMEFNRVGGESIAAIVAANA